MIEQESVLQKQEQQILGNPFSSIPVIFGVSQNESGGLRVTQTLVDSRLQRPGKRPIEVKSAPEAELPGSIVVNPEVIGACGYVIPHAGTNNGNPSQRLWIQTKSPNLPDSRITVEFHRENPDVSDGKLNLMIVKDFIPPDLDSASLDSQTPSVIIPLVVGPQATTLGAVPDAMVKAMAASDWASWLKGAWDIGVKVVPIIAKAGYEIYNELSKPKSDSAAPRAGGSFSDIVGSIAQVAVPLVGTALRAATGLFL